MLDGCKAEAQCEAMSCGVSSRSGHSIITTAVPIWPWDQASHGRACHDQDHPSTRYRLLEHLRVVARSIRVGLINTGLPAGSPPIRAIARSTAARAIAAES